MRATPVRNGRMEGSSWVVPSGNTATIEPPRRAPTASANMAELDSVEPSAWRCTGMTRAKSSSGRAAAVFHRVALAR